MSISEKTDFKTIPNQDQLKEVDRDLRFHPSQTQQPQALTKAQLEAYKGEGYVKGIRIFSDAEMVEHRRFFDGILAETLTAGQDSYSIISAHLKYGPVYDLLVHPRIVAYVKDILGENVIGWGAHFFCKLPGDGKVVSWHQDASY